MLDRRHLLKTAALLPAAGIATSGGMLPGLAAEHTRYIVDHRRPQAALLAAQARAANAAMFDPSGEIIALLIDPARRWLQSTGRTIGLTGYVDFALARDVLHHARNPVTHALALSGGRMTMVLGTPDTTAGDMLAGWAERINIVDTLRSTSFLWLA